MTPDRQRALKSLAYCLVINGNGRASLGPDGIVRIAGFQGFETEQLNEAIEAAETAHSLTLRMDMGEGK
jgi:hypothetical protein